MKIEMWPIGRVIPYGNNPRQNDAAVEAVAKSIREFGFRQPIVVDKDGVIVVGHTRWKAALKLGLKQVPVHIAKDLTPAQARAYRIADNQTATLAEWDDELLPLELAELKALDFDLDLLGFSQDELTEWLAPPANAGNCDPDDIPEPPDDATTQPGELIVLGNHRLLCADSSKAEDVDQLLDGAVVHLVNTDPPYNVRVEPRSNNAIAAGLSSFGGATHHQGLDVARHPGKAKPTGKKLRAKDRPLANDFVSDAEFERLLHAWFGNMARVLAPGRGFYIWGGYANCGNYPPVLKACELYFSQAIIWHKMHPVLTRKDFMGAHEWCQPPDTQVLTPYGAVYMKHLRQDDRVIPFNPDYARKLPRQGERVSVARRDYDGTLYGVVANDRVTHCTDGHLFTTRLMEHAKDAWCVYLMRRGPWWRVGKCKLTGQWYGFGVKARLRQERAEAAWILSTHPDQARAICAEQVVSVKYGIPTTHWEIYGTRPGLRGIQDIQGIYERLDLHLVHERALQALIDHGRRFEHPAVHAGNMRTKIGRRDPFLIRACNILPGYMSVPMTAHRRKVEYVPIRHVDRQRYEGPVYSLDVPMHRHYVADGIVTHNCFYGWKEGAAHKFFGPANVPDVWPIKKVNPQSMIHLTEKPVELAVRAMTYSSRPGENVLDLFGGSGSSLIAAEQTGRRAYLMEIDPLYCDVIIQRFERFSGQKAKRRTP